MSSHHQAVIWLAALLSFCFWFSFEFPTRSSDDTQAFLGTWTDELGKPGNEVRFYLVKANTPAVLGIQAWEGHVDFHKYLDDDEVSTIWNYESTRPLRLNVLFGKTGSFAALKMLDSDHMLMRISDDIDLASAADVFDSPKTKRLTRK